MPSPVKDSEARPGPNRALDDIGFAAKRKNIELSFAHLHAPAAAAADRQQRGDAGDRAPQTAEFADRRKMLEGLFGAPKKEAAAGAAAAPAPTPAVRSEHGKALQTAEFTNCRKMLEGLFSPKKSPPPAAAAAGGGGGGGKEGEPGKLKASNFVALDTLFGGPAGRGRGTGAAGAAEERSPEPRGGGLPRRTPPPKPLPMHYKPPPASAPAPASALPTWDTIPEHLQKYQRMLKMHIPEPAVRNKGVQDGVVQAEMDRVFLLASGGGGGAGAAAAPAPGPASASIGEVPEHLQKYQRMLNMRIPEPAVHNKMVQDGVGQAEIDQFLHPAAAAVAPAPAPAPAVQAAAPRPPPPPPKARRRSSQVRRDILMGGGKAKTATGTGTPLLARHSEEGEGEREGGEAEGEREVALLPHYAEAEAVASPPPPPPPKKPARRRSSMG